MVFSGLFLPSVEWEMKAEGFPWHEMESEPGDFGTLARNLRRRDVSPQRLMKQAIEALKALGQDNERAITFANALEAGLHAGALESNEIADRISGELPGLWGCFIAGIREEPTYPTAFMRAYVEIELASKRADAALVVGDFRNAAALVRADPMLNLFWRNHDLDVLATAQTERETLRPRLHAWLQLQLSVVARQAVRHPGAIQAQELCGKYSDLLTGHQIQPGVSWLRMAKRLAGAASLAQLREQLLLNSTDPASLPSEATFKRWNRGIIFPQRTDQLRTFIERVAARGHIYRPVLAANKICDALVRMYVTAHRLNHVGFFASLLWQEPATHVQRSFDEWCDHHRGTPRAERGA